MTLAIPRIPTSRMGTWKKGSFGAVTKKAPSAAVYLNLHISGGCRAGVLWGCSLNIVATGITYYLLQTTKSKGEVQSLTPSPGMLSPFPHKSHTWVLILVPVPVPNSLCLIWLGWRFTFWVWLWHDLHTGWHRHAIHLMMRCQCSHMTFLLSWCHPNFCSRGQPLCFSKLWALCFSQHCVNPPSFLFSLLLFCSYPLHGLSLLPSPYLFLPPSFDPFLISVLVLW